MKTRWKLVVIALVLGYSVWALLPSMRYYSMNEDQRNKLTNEQRTKYIESAIKLGLDLQGGAHLVAVDPAGVLDLTVGGHQRRGGIADGGEADHERPGERPGLAAQVAHGLDGDADFLADLPHDAGLEGLAALDEAGEHGVAVRRPDRLAGQQDLVPAVVHEADHGRVGTRVFLTSAAGAVRGPAGPLRLDRGPALGAEPGVVVPAEHGDGGGEQPGVLVAEQAAAQEVSASEAATKVAVQR